MKRVYAALNKKYMRFIIRYNIYLNENTRRVDSICPAKPALLNAVIQPFEEGFNQGPPDKCPCESVWVCG